MLPIHEKNRYAERSKILAGYYQNNYVERSN